MAQPLPSEAGAPRQTWLRRGFEALLPAPMTVTRRERLRAVVGAALGVGLAALLSRWLGGGATPWLVASLGASSVLVFAAPAGPMAQPWAAIGGNTVSALAGIACVRLIDDPVLAAAAAASLALAAMYALRCLHPPGGAVALTAVLLHTVDPRFALFPVATNTTLLVLAGIAWHRVFRRRYPHSQQPTPKPAGEIGPRFSAADLDAALAHYDEVLDVSRDDLEALLQDAELHAYQRLFGGLRCAEIMAREPVTVQFGTALAEAWALMRRHEVKALPVIDRAGRIVGIVTRADFLREANLDSPEGIGERVKELVRSAGTVISSKPEVVGQIMTRRVRITREDRHVVDLVAAFSEDGHHHLPVVDGDGKVVGMITQSDVVRALSRAIEPDRQSPANR